MFDHPSPVRVAGPRGLTMLSRSSTYEVMDKNAAMSYWVWLAIRSVAVGGELR